MPRYNLHPANVGEGLNVHAGQMEPTVLAKLVQLIDDAEAYNDKYHAYDVKVAVTQLMESSEAKKS